MARDGGEGWVRPDRVHRCGSRVAGLVGVHAEAGGSAYFSGIETCGSIWACPVCSPIIRARRADEIQRGADFWAEEGGAVLMVTFTLRHRREDGLRDSLGLLQRAYTRLMNSRGWKALMRRYGYAGQIRAIETPWGLRNGWHPHTHTLLMLAGLEDDALESIEREIFDLWEAALLKEGGRSIVRDHGVKVSRGAAAYVAKVQEHDETWLAGSELARGDLKRGRNRSFMPFELLDLDGEKARALWLEYVEVTKGRRAILWSRGLRERLGVEDVTDEEIVEEESSAETAPLVYLLDGLEYDALCADPAALVALLEQAEEVANGGSLVDEGGGSG